MQRANTRARALAALRVPLFIASLLSLLFARSFLFVPRARAAMRAAMGTPVYIFFVMLYVYAHQRKEHGVPFLN